MAKPDHPRVRTAVLQMNKSTGDLLAVTHQAARVIDESANDETWCKAALAA